MFSYYKVTTDSGVESIVELRSSSVYDLSLCDNVVSIESLGFFEGLKHAIKGLFK